MRWRRAHSWSRQNVELLTAPPATFCEAVLQGDAAAGGMLWGATGTQYSGGMWPAAGGEWWAMNGAWSRMGFGLPRDPCSWRHVGTKASVLSLRYADTPGSAATHHPLPPRPPPALRTQTPPPATLPKHDRAGRPNPDPLRARELGRYQKERVPAHRVARPADAHHAPYCCC